MPSNIHDCEPQNGMAKTKSRIRLCNFTSACERLQALLLCIREDADRIVATRLEHLEGSTELLARVSSQIERASGPARTATSPTTSCAAVVSQGA